MTDSNISDVLTIKNRLVPSSSVYLFSNDYFIDNWCTIKQYEVELKAVIYSVYKDCIFTTYLLDRRIYNYNFN